MINILITGCAGFIGRSLVKRLQNSNLKKKYYIYGIDNLSSSKKEQVPKKIKFIKGNCEDDRTLKKLNNKEISINRLLNATEYV
jgi:nucleoside-diphosphate-sugar epimerase